MVDSQNRVSGNVDLHGHCLSQVLIDLHFLGLEHSRGRTRSKVVESLVSYLIDHLLKYLL